MLESSVVVTAGELVEVAAGYRRYLLVERGLSDATAECYEPRARRFLAHRDGPEGPPAGRADGRRCERIPRARVPAAWCRVGAAAGVGRPFAAAVPVCGWVDHCTAGVGGARCGRVERPVAAAGPRFGDDHRSARSLRSAAHGRPAQLRDLAAAVSAGAAGQ